MWITASNIFVLFSSSILKILKWLLLKNEAESVYNKPFLFGVSKCLPISILKIGHVCSLSSTVIPSHRELVRWGDEGGWGGWRGGPGGAGEGGGAHLHLPVHRPFNPQLHPSIVMWQWQNIPKILNDCWGVWHLSLAMKCPWQGNMLSPCCRFPNSETPEEHFIDSSLV